MRDENNYTSQSKARLMQYKYQLQTLRKGSLSMREYLNKVKTYCDILAFVGQKLTEEEQVLHVLSGLGSEYDLVMVTITSKIEPFSLKDTQALFLRYESRLEGFSSTSVNSKGSALSANVATQNQFRRLGAHFSQNNRDRGQQVQNHYQNFRRGISYGRDAFRGRGDRSYNPNRPQCQLCHIFGHTVDRCYYKFDTNFTGLNNTQPRNTTDNGNGNSSLMPSTNQMSAMFLSPENSNDTSWYPDSGATNHITNDLANFKQNMKAITDYMLAMKQVCLSHI